MSRLTLSVSTLVALAALIVGVLLLGPLGMVAGWSADPPSEWLQHRADAARSGFVDDTFDTDLSLRWIHRSRQAPVPAWRGEDTRMPFDQVHHPVVVSRGLMYFGSSAECAIIALDAATGEERWRHFTDAPVRFAPAVWEDRLFAVSDDGGMHVLEADSGRLLQQIELAPRRDMLLGNDRMISRWPARGGPVVKDGIVYFGVGIWPSEGVYVCALDAATGEIVWNNDDSGGLEWDQPHGGARAESGISAQGYLVATDEQLLVPTGRGVPAGLSRADGALQYFHLQLYGKPTGGATIVAVDDFFFNGGHYFEEATGLSAGRVPDRHLMVAAPGRVICSDGPQLTAIGWSESEVIDRHGERTVVRQPHPVPLSGADEDLSVDGAIGAAVSLSGAGEHVSMEAPWEGAPDTFAAWLKIPRDATDGRVGIIAGNYPDSVSVNWEVHGNGRPRIYWNRGDVDWRPNVDLRTGEWLHYAFVRDAENGRITFYLDGAAVATHDDAGDDISVDATFNIGGDKRGLNAPWFHGAIDDLRVYDRSLSAEEIAALARREAPELMPAEGLIAHLPLDERPAIPGERVGDASGNGAHGRLVSLSGLEAPHEVHGMIAVGDTLVVGGPGVVSALDLRARRADRMVTWQAEVGGEAAGLAWAAGRLYVSTEDGSIYCFGPDDGTDARVLEPEIVREPRDRESARAAMEILRQSGVTEGYALDLGCGEGRLAEELARRTDLHVIGIEADPQKVAAARERLTAAGLYGTRVTVHHGDPAATPYPNYFADLVVSSRALERGPNAVPEAEMMRVLRPWGGVAVVGSLPGMRTVERGELPGAGRWTHQYCDAANSLTSTDEIVQGRLGMLWFTDFEDVRMPDRHGRGPAPLFADGRLFVLGKHGLHALSAYNGRLLWEYEVEDILTPWDQEHLLGTAVSGSAYCFGQESVYLRHEDYAVRLDAATGEELRRFSPPRVSGGQPGRWGFIATEDGTLFGGVANEDHVTMWAWSRASEMEGMEGESDALFALDAVTGEHRWTYEAEESIRHNAIAIGDGRVYLIDRPIARDDLLDRQERRADSGNRLFLAGESAGHPFGTLVALDARSGDVIWRADDEVFGTMLALSVEHDVLVMSYQHNRSYRLRSEVGGRMAGYRASTGEPLWSVKGINQQSRIMLNDEIIYAQGGAWSLLNGEAVPFEFSRSYGCGILAASRNMLVFRSATLGYRNLAGERTENYGGIRPGCWINTIPAGGLVLMPDATHGCTCSYLNKAHIALQPMGEAG